MAGQGTNENQQPRGECLAQSACSACLGFKRRYDFHGRDLGECEVCNGHGKLTREQTHWVLYGKKLKSERIEQGLTLRAAARHLGVDPSNLSKMERGVIKPQPLWQNAEADPARD